MLDFFIYNSETKEKEQFRPNKKGEIALYVCGITVYDNCHIGHARMAIVYDYIVKFLRTQGWNVRYIRNITDIDDKIINRANESGESILDLTSRFIEEMKCDFNKLGCISPDDEPKATAHIHEMQNIIRILLEKRHAYVAENGDVYFSVDSFSNYGKLSGRKVEDMMSTGDAIEGVTKKNPFDFVLWKSAKPLEPFWQSEWGNGRPGWHIECSAMSTSKLGNNIDIHGGGLDLLFPHHENEIAQSECAFDTKFVNYWMHVGFINVDGKKMSKSLGNYVTIKDALKKYHPEVIRLFMLSSHYRQPINYCENTLNQMKSVLTRVYSFYQKNDLQFNQISYDYEFNDLVKKSSQINKFNKSMSNDFNTIDSISIMHEVIEEMLSTNDEYIRSFKIAQLDYMGDVFGIFKDSPKEFLLYSLNCNLSEREILECIEKRAVAKFNKDFALADYLRDHLSSNNVIIEDNRNGKTTWFYGVK